MGLCQICGPFSAECCYVACNCISQERVYVSSPSSLLVSFWESEIRSPATIWCNMSLRITLLTVKRNNDLSKACLFFCYSRYLHYWNTNGKFDLNGVKCYLSFPPISSETCPQIKKDLFSSPTGQEFPLQAQMFIKIKPKCIHIMECYIMIQVTKLSYTQYHKWIF